MAPEHLRGRGSTFDPESGDSLLHGEGGWPTDKGWAPRTDRGMGFRANFQWDILRL